LFDEVVEDRKLNDGQFDEALKNAKLGEMAGKLSRRKIRDQ